MLKIFRTNQILIGSLFIIPIVLLHLLPFIFPAQYTPIEGGILSKWVFSLIGANSITAHLLTIILVLIQSLQLSYIVIKFRFLERDNLFVGLIYLILSALFAHYLYLSPFLLANTFSILALGQLLNIYKKNRVAINIFNTGFFLGIATLFHPAYSIFILPTIISINIQRSYRLTEWFMAIIGFLLPVFHAFTYYFWYDQHHDFFNDLFLTPKFIALPILNNPFDYIEYGILALLLIVVAFTFSANTNRVIMEIKKKTVTLYWMLLFGFIALFLQSQLNISSFLLLTPFIACLLAFSISRQRDTSAQASFLFLLILALFLQYGPLFILK